MQGLRTENNRFKQLWAHQNPWLNAWLSELIRRKHRAGQKISYLCVCVCEWMGNRCTPFCCTRWQCLLPTTKYLSVINKHVYSDISLQVSRCCSGFRWIQEISLVAATADVLGKRYKWEKGCTRSHIAAWQRLSIPLSASSLAAGIPLTSSSSTCRNAIKLRPSQPFKKICLKKHICIDERFKLHFFHLKKLWGFISLEFMGMLHFLKGDKWLCLH